MGTTTDEHDHGHDGDHDHDAAAVTEEVHDNSWSANLEKPRHAENRDLILDGAIQAVDHTAPGNHVNLVTHGDHGHPQGHLFPALAEATWDRDVTWEYVEQCGCGGHVTRVHVE